MCLWAIVPVKPLHQGKSRLGGVLTQEERYLLNSNMLRQTLEVLKNVPQCEHVLVVSRDEKVIDIARQYDFLTLLENSEEGLNWALTKATEVSLAHQATSLMIIPTDLPLISPDVVQDFIQKTDQKTHMVKIAPDRKKEGTNILLLKPGGVITYAYGKNSFKKHLSLAQENRIASEVFVHPLLELDIDTPDDLKILYETEYQIPFKRNIQYLDLEEK